LNPIHRYGAKPIIIG